MTRLGRWALIGAASLVTVACGFALMPPLHFPPWMKTTSLVTPNPNGRLARLLRDSLTREGIRVVRPSLPHGASLVIFGPEVLSRVLAVNGQGEPAEYLVSYHVHFRLERGTKTVFGPSAIRLRQTYFYLPLSPLAVNSESYNLTRTLERKAARLILYRLASPRASGRPARPAAKSHAASHAGAAVRSDPMGVGA
ncbi:LPS-assembly lipoprotein RlpB [mine drainage metagenome]|uniref:LPS-assembly lipoprotein RlpB n=1 Tax=mine drainage metagenome TaxID=410659 RepID=T1BBJ9_9ZZZZ